MKYLFFLIPVFLFAFNEDELKACYKKGLGDDKCGKELAYYYKGKAEYDAAEIFLDLSIKGDVDSTRELGMLYIYGREIPQDCKKGVALLLSSATQGEESIVSFLEVSNLFKNGICLPKDDIKYKKYYDIYMEKMKAKIKT